MNRRIEGVLEEALAHATASAPPTLAEAMRHAVFPGGARVRPALCLEVARACGVEASPLVDAAGAALELLHCASLVHDDLPCFDDAELRRGRPSVHRRYGEATAVLVGDGLIVLAFELLGRAGAHAPERLGPLLGAIAAGVGSPGGLVAGQAWETERSVDVERYHQAKTASLFVAAATAGAIAAGVDPGPWRAMGVHLGAAYQVADDLLDAHGATDEAGKPTSQDLAHGRPSAVTSLGTAGALARLEEHVQAAAAAVPSCPGAEPLRGLVVAMAKHLVPAGLRQTAA